MEIKNKLSVDAKHIKKQTNILCKSFYQISEITTVSSGACNLENMTCTKKITLYLFVF